MRAERLRRWTEVVGSAPEWRVSGTRVAVIVPHPDDESLSTGGLIAVARRAGGHVRVIAVTDGEHAYPGVVEPASLAARRRDEQTLALQRLGVRTEDVVRLGMVDGGVGRSEHRLVHLLAAHIADADLLVAPWTGDHHVDHEACGRAAVRLALRFGIPHVLAMFWTYHHSDPEHIPHHRLRQLRLPPAVHLQKAHAVAAHSSQVGDAAPGDPLLDDALLGPARWPFEGLVLGE